MSRLDGIFRCEQLGVDDCVVWWDALAAASASASVVVALGALAIAWIGIAVGAASAIAVWKLGLEANRLAHAPAEEAREQAGRERVVLLSALYGELINVSSVAGAWHEAVVHFGIDHLLDNDESRENCADSLGDIDMPLARSVIGRLHVLPANESSTLARCLGLVSVLHMSVDTLKSNRRGAHKDGVFIETLVADAKLLENLSQSMANVSLEQIYLQPE